MVDKHRADYGSEWAAMTSIAGKIGSTAETLRRWCREEASRRAGPAALAANDRDRLKLLERDVHEASFGLYGTRNVWHQPAGVRSKGSIMRSITGAKPL